MPREEEKQVTLKNFFAAKHLKALGMKKSSLFSMLKKSYPGHVKFGFMPWSQKFHAASVKFELHADHVKFQLHAGSVNSNYLPGM